MAGYQSTQLIGNIGRDPEQRFAPDGTPVCSFSLGVTEGKDKPTDWWEVSLWGKQAEAVGPYLTKGRQVFVVGKASARAYLSKQNNEPVAALKLRAFQVQLLGSKPDGAGQQRRYSEAPYDIELGDIGPPLDMDNYGGAGFTPGT